MAGKTISQRISLEGSEDIRKALEALGNAGAQAFKQIQDAAKEPVFNPAQLVESKQAIDQLVKSGSELARQFLALADQVNQFGTASAQAAGSVDKLAGANDNLAGSAKQAGAALKQAEVSTGSFLGTLGRITATVGVVGAALTAAGTAAFAFAKSMATSVNEIVKSAAAAKQSAQSYQQLNFVLQQMGLSPKEAEEAIKSLGEATKNSAKEGEAALRAFGFRFAPVTDGVDGLADQLARLPVIVGSMKTFFPAAAGDEEKIRRIREVLSQFDRELPKTAEQAKNLADALLGITETENSQKMLLAFRDTLRVLGAEFPSTEAGSEKLQATLLKMAEGLSAAQAGSEKTGNALASLTPLLLQGQRAAKAFAEGRDQDLRQLAAFADGLSKIKDPATQATIATNIWDKEIAEKLLPTLRKGGAEVLKFGDDFKRLGLGLTGTNIENANKFGEAIKGFTQEMLRLGAVSEKGKINLGSIFQPIFTPLIVAATKALREYTNATAGAGSILESFGKVVATVVGPAVQALIGLLPKLTTLLQTPDLGKDLAEGILSFGRSVVEVIKGIVVPAFNLLVTAAKTTAETINSIFGTKLTGADVALLGIITSLIGGFKTLAFAAAGLFVGTGSGLDVFRAKLKELGIDIQAIKEVIVGFAAKTIADFKNAFAGMDDKVTQGWVLTLRNALLSLPAVVVTVLAALLLLKKGLSSVAAFITQVFKVPASALGVGLVAAILQLTGILPLFTQLLIGAAAASTLLRNVVAGISFALGAMAAVVGWPVLLAAGIVLLIANFDKLKAVLEPVARALNALFGTKLTGGELLVGTIVALGAALAILVTRATVAADIFIAGGTLAAGLGVLAGSFAAVTIAMAIFLALFKEVQDVMSGDFNKRLAQTLKDQEEITKAFQKGGPNAMLEKVKELEAANRAAAEAAKKLGDEQSKAGEKGSGALAGAKEEARSLIEEARKIGAELMKSMQEGIQGANQLGTAVDKSLRKGKVIENPFFNPEAVASDQQRLLDAFQRLGQKIEEDKRKADELKGAISDSPGFVKLIGSATTLEDKVRDDIRAVTDLKTAIESLPDLAKGTVGGKRLEERLPPVLQDIGGRRIEDQRADAAGRTIANIGAQIDNFVSDLDQAMGRVIDFLEITATEISRIFSGLGTEITTIGQTISTAFVSAVESIEAVLSSITWDAITSTGGAAWNVVVSAVQSTQSAIEQFSSSLSSITWDAISSTGVQAWNSVTQAIREAIDAISQYTAAASGAFPGGAAGGPVGGFQSGGLLGGRGTGTSDSNLVRVSRGEYIVPASAVRQPGVLALLEALRRSGGNLRDVLDDIGRFALGGMVPRAIPAFAAGGLAGGGMSNVTIQFPGMPEISGLRAPAKVVDELRKAAALAQVRSGGRKPSRYM